MPVSVAAPARGVTSGPRGNAPARTARRTTGRRARTECAGCTAPSFAHLEAERKHFGHADFGVVGQCGFGAVGQPAAVEPGSVAALVGDGEPARGWIAAQAQVLARHFVARVEREVHPKALAAASHADFVLCDE